VTVYFYKGLPGSGKDTDFIKRRKQNSRLKRINKDFLREMVDNSEWNRKSEDLIIASRDALLELYLSKEYDVAITDTNFAPIHYQRVLDIATKYNANVETVFLDVSLQECLLHDSKRERSVGEKIIRDMYFRYIHKDREVLPYNESLPDAIICDVDGTLSKRHNRGPFEYSKVTEDLVNLPIVDLLSRLSMSDESAEIFIFSGRENVMTDMGCVLDLTRGWLYRNGIPFDRVVLRKEGDYRPDYEVKEEMYREHVENKYNVLWWIDDRKQVIDHMRFMGLPVLDVAGNTF
jgi:predicted kinase